jgi:hypothetical protein
MSIRFLDYYISGRANCNPHRFQPSMGMVRTTCALSIRTVCRNFRFLRAGATGISSDTRDRRRKGLRIASNAPPALSLSKVQNSMNSRPCPSTPRTNTGMARESRTQRRRSAAGWLAAVGLRPRRMGNHSRTEDVCQAGLTRMTCWVGSCRRELLDHVIALDECHLKSPFRVRVLLSRGSHASWTRKGNAEAQTSLRDTWSLAFLRSTRRAVSPLRSSCLVRGFSVHPYICVRHAEARCIGVRRRRQKSPAHSRKECPIQCGLE